MLHRKNNRLYPSVIVAHTTPRHAVGHSYIFLLNPRLIYNISSLLIHWLVVHTVQRHAALKTCIKCLHICVVPSLCLCLGVTCASRYILCLSRVRQHLRNDQMFFSYESPKCLAAFFLMNHFAPFYFPWSTDQE